MKNISEFLKQTALRTLQELELLAGVAEVAVGVAQVREGDGDVRVVRPDVALLSSELTKMK